MPAGYEFAKCFDPYLRYAISTEFGPFEPLDGKARLFFLGELKKLATKSVKQEFVDDMRETANVDDIEFGPPDEKIHYVTLRTKKNAVLTPKVYTVWDKHFSRVALSIPLSSRAKVGSLSDRWARSTQSPGPLLIGVIDDGCPFAAAQFRNGPTNTRVLAIWDQDQGRKQIHFPGINNQPGVFGEELPDFKYGLEYLRDSETPAAALLHKKKRRIGLNEWIGLHLTPNNTVDEDGCYRDTDFKNLAARRSHGAHVMDVFSGKLPTSSRIGPLKAGQDRRDPPSWQTATDLAASSDIVFVQFPENCIKDATGVWLKAYVMDAIGYILSFADPNKTDTVVVNLSYGPTTGPHDGTHELEQAMIALVNEYDGYNKKPKLEIVLAAGNTYLSEGHVEFTGVNPQPSTVEWTWRVAADNSVLNFAEIWMEGTQVANVRVKLRSPSGVAYGLPTSTSVASVGAPIPWGTSKMWRLEVGPTIIRQKGAPSTVNPNYVAEHGDWKITVTGIRKGATMHAYVARTDPNLGARTGARRSYFADPKWERRHGAFAACMRVDGETDKSGSLINPLGTLNGIATTVNSSVLVAGGFIVSNGRKSSYASAGPARSGPLPQRTGPDYALPCDETSALQGIRAGGTRSGGTFRLTGTSTAAPQLARHATRLAGGKQLPTPSRIPSTNLERQKRGRGNLEPP
ncbi:MAG: hypothetical protein AB7I42_07460 [Bradyrhizobium sp.]|uniref:hypothetical protein n=1 Tax=Bradyrhizobium sp. TaxID=376 RepID=UPI002A323991|nr:hypothetical protein [Bradyrhizobium sp.]